MLPSPRAKHRTSGQDGTVLVRQAQPKYNFIGRKLPKETPEHQDSCSTLSNPECIKSAGTAEQDKLSLLGSSNFSVSTNHNFQVKESLSGRNKPVAVVEASCQGKTEVNSFSTEKFSSSHSMPVLTSAFNSNYSSTNILSNSARNYKDSQTVLQTSRHFSLSPTPSQNSDTIVSDSQKTSGNSELDMKPTETSINFEANPVGSTVQFPSTQTLAMQVIQKVDSTKQQLKCIEDERDQLKRDLDVQLKVNAELKKLLIASVGEDLGDRVERLARERAQLSTDIGGFSKKMSEDYENLDKISIQADMWRSKYLASRVMVEELGNARAFYSLQCNDAHDALQQLLNERHELRTNLFDTYKVLHQVKNAFDPLNCQRSSSLASTNVLDLCRSAQQLAEAVRFRLLPAHVAIPVVIEGESDRWENCVTRAEQFAHEVLSRPAEPVGSLQSGSSRLLPVTGTPQCGSLAQISRFHPHTRHENLTFNCCDRCKGDINVL